MSRLSVTALFLYRWRYQLGYIIISIGLIAVLIFAGLYLPGGVSDQEMQSVVKSNTLSHTDIGSLAITNLPYHAMQQASISLFGVNDLSIKLPSIILAFLSAVGLILLLRHWFKPNVAVLVSLMAITTGQFIFIAQDGTPNILYLFWPVWLMLLGILISKRQKPRTFYKITFFIAAALSLYTPLSIYVLIALVTAIFLHPHLRYLIRQLSKSKILIGLCVAALLTVPLIAAIIKTPRLGLDLLGIPTAWPDLGANIASLGAQYLGFANPGGTTIMTPFFELGSMLIIAIGAYHVIKSRETAKSYVIALWALCLIPFIILNPDFAAVSYLPLVLLLASGFSALLSYWYVVFPRNPYARVAGLIPLIILVSVLVLSGVERYIHGYQYDPNIAPNFSNDLRLLPDGPTNLVVAGDEQAFYQVVAEHDTDLSISTEPSGDSFIATRDAKRQFDGYAIDQIITTSTKDASDRFYVYTKITE